MMYLNLPNRLLDTIYCECGGCVKNLSIIQKVGFEP